MSLASPSGLLIQALNHYESEKSNPAHWANPATSAQIHACLHQLEERLSLLKKSNQVPNKSQTVKLITANLPETLARVQESCATPPHPDQVLFDLLFLSLLPEYRPPGASLKARKKVLGDSLLEILDQFISGVEGQKKITGESTGLISRATLDFFTYVLSNERETITAVKFSPLDNTIQTEITKEAHGRLRLVKLTLEILAQGKITRCKLCKALFLKKRKTSKFCTPAHRREFGQACKAKGS